VLPVDLVHVRRQKDRLVVMPLGDRVLRARELAAELVDIAEAHVGRTREELEGAWRAVDVPPREIRLRDGLVALIEDALALDTRDELDAAALRAEVFTRATQRRRSEGGLDRAALLGEIAAERGVDVEAIEQSIYADLRGAQVLRAPESRGGQAATLVPGGARGIVDRYDLAQAQAVLLRATRVVVTLKAAPALALRALLRKLKFHRLLFSCEREAERIVLTIDGPSALFESTTRYGLALAVALPSVLACAPERVEAELRWGKERLPLRFVLEPPSPLLDAGDGAPAGEPGLPDEVAALLTKLRAKGERFEASVAEVLLDIPGVGLTVPDLTLTERGSGRVVHVEVLGHWSRDAVWKRVELAERGLPEPVLFCASERLRVSEAVLPETTGASLYVYKGALSANLVLERAERLAARAPARAPAKKSARVRPARG
jgi:predicted nuclease of restriction endonuclease-like RecB superfamily